MNTILLLRGLTLDGDYVNFLILIRTHTKLYSSKKRVNHFLDLLFLLLCCRLFFLQMAASILFLNLRRNGSSQSIGKQYTLQMVVLVLKYHARKVCATRAAA